MHNVSKLVPFLLLIVSFTYAKTNFNKSTNLKFANKQYSSVNQFEQKFSTYFQLKSIRAKNKLTNSQPIVPDERDLQYLAKNWSTLSNSFKSLYLKSLEIPDSSLSYISPSGKFEIFYRTKGYGKVDSTDKYAYSKDGNWRTRVEIKNGIPDYVDEVAWAMDSSWSMEIDRFGFVKPYSYDTLGFKNSPYKVVITDLYHNSLYGQTYPFSKSSDPSSPQKGFQSLIEINSDWSDWPEFGYDKNPEKAIRVTAAHEFFHAIQYAMSWIVIDNVYLDEFPLTWTEATGVLMEELAFDDVNDYVQYSETLFNNPNQPLLNDDSNYEIHYMNSILLMFLHKKLEPNGIGFFKTIYFNNYEKPLPFKKNLDTTCSQYGINWQKTLNEFHRGSYFTGVRADTSKFLKDAALFDSWDVNFDSLDLSYTVSKEVDSFGMQTFAIQSLSTHNDTLKIYFRGDYKPTSLPYTWAVSVILNKNVGDSILQFNLQNSNYNSLIITNWHTFKNCIVIATNGDPHNIRIANVNFVVCPVIYKNGSSSQKTIIGPNNESTSTINYTATNDLRCDLSFTKIPADSFVNHFYTLSFQPITDCFEILYPLSWENNFQANLQIAVKREKIESLSYTQRDSMELYFWNQLEFLFEKIPTQFSQNTTHFTWSAPISKAGKYALLTPKEKTSNRISLQIFPNPVSLTFHNGKGVTFVSKGIQKISIFSLDGSLIYNNSPESQPNQLSVFWNLRNNANKQIVPGTYIAVVSVINPVTRGLYAFKRKLMIIP